MKLLRTLGSMLNSKLIAPMVVLTLLFSATVATAAPPSATLISPSGSISTSNPAYVWNAVSSSTWYQLWVTDSTANPKVLAWYTAAQAGCASGTGTCSITPATALANGAATWWIQTWNPSGYGPWSDALAFSVISGGGLPGKATLVAPSGTIGTNLPAYTWSAVSGATYYLLYVNDSAVNGKIQTWYTSTAAG